MWDWVLLLALSLAATVLRAAVPQFLGWLLDRDGAAPPLIPARRSFGWREWAELEEFGYVLSPSQRSVLQEYRQAFPPRG
jgi:hypothetical protein